MALYDDDESFCEEEPAVDEIDWDAVQLLERRQAHAYQSPVGEERSWAMLELLTELHGDDLRVL